MHGPMNIKNSYLYY